MKKATLKDAILTALTKDGNNSATLSKKVRARINPLNELTPKQRKNRKASKAARKARKGQRK